MSSLPPHPGFELVWVNASPKGPTSLFRAHPDQYYVMRIPHGKSKTVSRSNADTTYSAVNDLDDTLFFPGAKVVSRDHATLEWQGDRLIVKDNGSTHGTFVSHRQAKLYPHDQIYQGNPHAVKKRVDGIMELQEGDLIEFGKDCHRTAQSYHPVRCYLRAMRQPTTILSTASSPKKSSAISVVDDLFDSDSDIVSVAADTVNTRKKTPPPATAETPHEIVDLTSEDEEDSGEESHDANDRDNTFKDQSSVDKNDIHNDVPIPLCEASVNHGSQSAIFDSAFLDSLAKPTDAHQSGESDSSSDEDVDSFDFSRVPWRNEIHEAAREQVELTREDQDARIQGEAYMSQYKNAQQPETMQSGFSSYKTAPEEPYSPATSAAASAAADADSPILDAAKDESFNSRALGDMLVQSAVKAGITPAEAVVPTQAVEQPSPSPLKRKLDIQDLRDSTYERIEQISTSVSPCTTSSEASSSTDDSASSAASTSLSSSPSPSKKRRVDHSHAGRVSTRARKIRAIAAKTIQATSLLSFGFLAGSLFTFKSMMNAAAAANAAGPSK